MTNVLSNFSDGSIERLIQGLDSLHDGGLAENMLIANGPRAVPYLRDFLLNSRPRSIAEPRCRAVRVLGELGSYTTLLDYFREYHPPTDAAVLFAEDAVRSLAAHELMRAKSEKTFRVLLQAAEQRVTGGLLLALGEFRRTESIPLLFRSLEDDLCRDSALTALHKVPEPAREYAIHSLEGLTNIQVCGGCVQWRCRATLKLLQELDVLIEEWGKLRPFLFEEDADVVLSTAQIGFRVAPTSEHPPIIYALIRVADKFNWLQERDVTELLIAQGPIARRIASSIQQNRRDHGVEPQWDLPSCRVLQHVLDGNIEGRHYGTA
jgi:hypothetical protein